MPVEPIAYLTQLGMRAIGARAGVEPLTIPWISAWPGDAPAIPPDRLTPPEHGPRGDDDHGSPPVEAGGDSVGQAQADSPAVAPKSDAGSLRRQRVSASPASHAAAEPVGSAQMERFDRILPSEVPPVARQAASPGTGPIGPVGAHGRLDAPTERTREMPTTSPVIGAPEPPLAGRDGAPPRGRLVSQASPPGARDTIQPVAPSATRGVTDADTRRGQAVRPPTSDAPRTTPDVAPRARAPASFLATTTRSAPPRPAATERSAGGDRHSLAPDATLEHGRSKLDVSGKRGTAEQGGGPADRPATDASSREAPQARLSEPAAPARARQAASGPVAIAKPLEREVDHARRLAAAGPPVVRVRIGRIEIKAERPAPQTSPRRASAPAEPARPRVPAMLLADYLKRRDGGTR
jgi:hypothetical protein